MEQITKFYKLICGVLIIIFCALPLLVGVSGFTFFKGGVLDILCILLILAGAGALIFVSLTKDIEVLPKFKLSTVAKLAITLGLILVLAIIIFYLIGMGFILIVLAVLALFFEEKIVKLLNK